VRERVNGLGVVWDVGGAQVSLNKISSETWQRKKLKRILQR
jgi:hypothetical protein